MAYLTKGNTMKYLIALLVFISSSATADINDLKAFIKEEQTKAYAAGYRETTQDICATSSVKAHVPFQRAIMEHRTKPVTDNLYWCLYKYRDYNYNVAYHALKVDALFLSSKVGEKTTYRELFSHELVDTYPTDEASFNKVEK